MPPLYMPSSGEIVSVKCRMSSGSGKSVFIVVPRDRSERSGGVGQLAAVLALELLLPLARSPTRASDVCSLSPFCTLSCAAVTFFFLAPPAAAAWSFCCCCFCASLSVTCKTVYHQPKHAPLKHTMDHIFNILDYWQKVNVPFGYCFSVEAKMILSCVGVNRQALKESNVYAQ